MHGPRRATRAFCAVWVMNMILRNWNGSGSRPSNTSSVSTSSTANISSTGVWLRTRAFWPKALRARCSTWTSDRIRSSPPRIPSAPAPASVWASPRTVSARSTASSRPTARASAAARSLRSCSTKRAPGCAVSAMNTAPLRAVNAAAAGSTLSR